MIEVTGTDEIRSASRHVLHVVLSVQMLLREGRSNCQEAHCRAKKLSEEARTPELRLAFVSMWWRQGWVERFWCITCYFRESLL